MRLAVVDLSSAGHQPMLSHCERYVVVFNGEVYNFSSLREELEPRGHKFRGHSDTLIILASIVEWGLESGSARAHPRPSRCGIRRSPSLVDEDQEPHREMAAP